MAGKGSTVLTFEEREKIEYLLKSGYKTGGIASILGRAHSAIKKEIRRNGSRQDYNASVAQKASELRHTAKIDKLRKNLSESQIDIIKTGITEGWSQNKIRALAGCSHWRISEYFKRNKIDYIPKNYTTFDERIAALEQQIEIILDLLRRNNV